jgi:hypothetical protein
VTTIPVRNLAERGLLPDPHPYDLPTNAFTAGSNIRFEVGKVRRAPVFRSVRKDLPKTPAFVVGYRSTSSFDTVFTAASDGAITSIRDDLVADVTPTDRTTAAADQAWTSCYLGDVLYLNTPSQPPAAFRPTDNKFVTLPEWDPTWRCRSLRAFKNILLAINVTKGPDAFPAMVKWSDIALTGQVPGSWDVANLSTIANEVETAQLDSPWVDGMPLKDGMVLYSENQIWGLDYTGDTSDAAQNLITFRCLFTDGGLIAPNCAVEVLGRHYVFGTTDIYVHDGLTRESISSGRIREWIYGNLNSRLADRCFALHMPKYNEIVFGFVSGDNAAHFPDPTGCNRGAVYNYVTGVWSLIDLPNVCGGTLANVDPSLLWNSPRAQTAWKDLGGTWNDLKDGYEDHVIFAAQIGGAITSNRILAYDHMDRGSLSYPYDPECNGSAFVERVGIDLDQEGSDLATYKVAKRVWPQVSTYRDTPLFIQIGSSMTPAGTVKWGTRVSFDPKKQYKVDVRGGGRYLAIRFFIDVPADFEVSGYDVDVVTGGRR